MSSSQKTSKFRSARVVERSVIIVEDTLLMAELLALHCTALSLRVIQICGTYREGLAAIRHHKPELVILDISLPDGDGLELAKIVAKESTQTRMIATSSHREPWTMERIKRSPIHGFVDKNEQCLDRISEAINAIFSGRRCLNATTDHSAAKQKKRNVAFHRILSDHEIRILSLVGECKSDDEIAVVVGISRWTTQSHRRDIMKKLGIHSTPKLIHYAIASGITRTAHWRADRAGLSDPK